VARRQIRQVRAKRLRSTSIAKESVPKGLLGLRSLPPSPGSLLSNGGPLLGWQGTRPCSTASQPTSTSLRNRPASLGLADRILGLAEDSAFTARSQVPGDAPEISIAALEKRAPEVASVCTVEGKELSVGLGASGQRQTIKHGDRQNSSPLRSPRWEIGVEWQIEFHDHAPKNCCVGLSVAPGKRARFISTITAISEANHVGDEAQTSHGR
jgi:hypothetical protein